MPQSLAHVLIHVVFSTKDRRPIINATVAPQLHAYVAGTVRALDCECLRVGGHDDHIHLAIRMSRTITAAKLVEEIKVASSKWMKDQGPDYAGFAWQRGYGLFSLSPSHLEPLLEYIERQPEHHRNVGFKEEFLDLLRKNGLEHDERYVWD
jgi:putative transposase